MTRGSSKRPIAFAALSGVDSPLGSQQGVNPDRKEGDIPGHRLEVGPRGSCAAHYASCTGLTVRALGPVARRADQQDQESNVERRATASSGWQLATAYVS
jgi:hypothetical protein